LKADLTPRPILVTGAHRTGTTWVGRLLTVPPAVTYISEPLNVLHRPGVLEARTPNWYTYICDENGEGFVPAFRQLLSFRYHTLDEIMALRSLHDVGRMVRDMAVFLDGRLHDRVPLLKDPFAVFSLRWFAEVLNCRIVVTIRHPAAFASGLKRLGWTFDFHDLLRQPLLMRDHCEAYREAMTSTGEKDIVGQAGLLWTMIYGALSRLRTRVPGIRVVRHEDLALRPVDGFRELYEYLGLGFTPQVERAVRVSSSAGNPVELSPRRTHAVKMDSKASLQNWRRRLSPGEVAQVRRLTQGVAEVFYPEESWN
jgi:hypothetical protein